MHHWQYQVHCFVSVCCPHFLGFSQETLIAIQEWKILIPVGYLEILIYWRIKFYTFLLKIQKGLFNMGLVRLLRFKIVIFWDIEMRFYMGDPWDPGHRLAMSNDANWRKMTQNFFSRFLHFWDRHPIGKMTLSKVVKVTFFAISTPWPFFGPQKLRKWG